MIIKGFYRILRSVPGYVVPIFGQDEKYYSQTTSDGVKISGFIPLGVRLDSSRFINHVDVEGLAPSSVGGDYILGYEYGERLVAVGNISELRGRVRELVDFRKDFAHRPFSRFEIARFLDDKKVQEQAAIECFKKLKDISDETAVGWLMDAAPELYENVTKAQYFDWNDDSDVTFRVKAHYIIFATLNFLCHYSNAEKYYFIDNCLKNLLNLPHERLHELSESMRFSNSHYVISSLYGERLKRLDFWPDPAKRLYLKHFRELVIENEEGYLVFETSDITQETRRRITVNRSVWHALCEVMFDGEKITEKRAGLLLSYALAYGSSDFLRASNFVTDQLMNFADSIFKEDLESVNR